MSDERQDNVTEAAETPDMEALHQAYDDAWEQDQYTDGRLAYVERIRYARWAGQSEDGLMHSADLAARGLKNPLYEGAPDNRVFIADDIIRYLKSLFAAAFWTSSMKTSPVSGRTLNAAQAGELWTLLNWLKNGALKSQLLENVEVAAQLMCMVGWCVLHPTWRNRKQMKLQRLTMEQVFALAQQASQAGLPGATPSGGNGDGGTPSLPGLLARAPEMILDPAQEDAAVELFKQLFPDFDTKEAKSVVRQLREEGEAEFPVEEETSIGPELTTLCPWVHFIIPQEATARPSDARVMFVRMQIPKWRVDQLAAEEEWEDPEFTRLLKESAGNSQQPPTTKEDDRDLNRNLCELVYAYRQVPKDGAARIYCTVMSPQVKPQEGEPGAYGKNWFTNPAHGKMPFVFARLEAADWCITDTRGVCDCVFSNQNQMKTFKDGAAIQNQLSNTPPVMALGTSATKLALNLAPFARVNAPSGKPWEVLNLTAGSKPELAVSMTEAERKEAEDRFGLPRADTPAERSQVIRQDLTNNFLGAFGEAFHQLTVLAYQNMAEDELEDILGHKPLLTADIVARHKVMLTCDVRRFDPEFIERLMKWMPIAREMDAGGITDSNKAVRLLYSYIDPSLMDEISQDESGAKGKIFRDVREEINNMALGNKPMLTQMDPTARMKMAFAQQIIGGNPRYQARLTPGHAEHDPEFLENVKNYMKNLQHSYQETTLSKAQGRLGVTDVGNFPEKEL